MVHSGAVIIMTDLILRIKEDDKAEDLIRFLRDIDFIDVEVRKSRNKQNSGIASLKEVMGIWKGRRITQKELRTKAWSSRGIKNDFA